MSLRQFLRNKPEFRGKIPERDARHGSGPRAEDGIQSVAGIDALCCGSAWVAGYDAGAETEKWRGTRGWRGATEALTFARLLPDRGRRDITITLVLYTPVLLKTIRGLIALCCVFLFGLPRLERNRDFLSQQFTRVRRKQRQQYAQSSKS